MRKLLCLLFGHPWWAKSIKERPLHDGHWDLFTLYECRRCCKWKETHQVFPTSGT